MAWLVAAAVALAVVAGLCASAEIALFRLARTSGRDRARDGSNGQSPQLQAVLAEPRRYVSVLMAVRVGAVTASVVLMTAALVQWLGTGWHTFLIAFAGMAALLYLVAGIWPVSLGRQYDRQLAGAAASVLAPVVRALGPLPRLLVATASVLTPGRSGREGSGESEEELRGLTLAEVTHPDDRDATDRGLDAVWEGRRTSYHIEKRMIRKDGDVIWVNITAAPVPATESNPEFLPAIVVNVTEQKRAEEALRVSRAELARVSRLTTMGELTASIAHEVNQPLAAIVASGNACRRWLAGARPNLDRARDSIDRMIKDAHRASEIITRIRSMTRNAPPVQLAVDINAVIDDVLGFAHGELLAKGVSVRPALLEGLPSITGDRVQLQQVVLNLVMNAVEAMASTTDRERVLAITSQRADDGDPIVSIEDSGHGLDAANADRIFDAFFTTKPGGMGMGLSISTSIVEAHGGRLWASPGLPHGTAFHFTLPATSGAEAHSDKGALISAWRN